MNSLLMFLYYQESKRLPRNYSFPEGNNLSNGYTLSCNLCVFSKGYCRARRLY